MQPENHPTNKPPQRPLQGRSAWIISDGKAGHEVQCLGVAEALGMAIEIKPIPSPSRTYAWRAPYGPAPRAARFGGSGSPFGPPYPAIALAAGRLTTPYLRALKKKAGLKTFTVILLDPKVSAASADLFWVPEHDKRRGANVITTLAAPHRFSPLRLAELRKSMLPAIAALPRPRVAILIGGPNGDYRFEPADAQRFAAVLATISASGAGLMMTPSRRTPPALLSAIDAATNNAPRFLWQGEGENPYAQFLAHADIFVVTADSVNMAGEAAATGKPIYIFHPSGGSAKFDRYHAALEAKGITRRLAPSGAPLELWDYQPLDSARLIAAEIERRWMKRAELLPGLCG